MLRGHPQKLPDFDKENKTDKPVTKSKIITGIFKKETFKSSFLSTKAFISQPTNEIKTSRISNCCLLKSKALNVKGRKKSGKRNTNR